MGPDDGDADAIAQHLATIACEAGRLLRPFQSGCRHHLKPDGSPTTEADLAAEELILSRLAAAWPGIPAIAEETASAVRPDDLFFLIDPLDGTRDFLHGADEYSVNIALVRGDRPIAAAVAAPALDRVWMAGAQAHAGEIAAGSADEIAWRRIAVRRPPPGDLVALVSRRHGDSVTEECLAALSIGTRRAASSALKFCLIASGEADVYVRCGATMEWDTAAGDHILTRAGGCVVGPGGRVFTYGHAEHGYRNGPFAALGDPALAPLLRLPVAVPAG